MTTLAIANNTLMTEVDQIVVSNACHDGTYVCHVSQRFDHKIISHRVFGFG
jgi:hypothetical protein